MLKIDDYITYIGHPEDVCYLREKAFPVNMRFFHTSEQYREIVLSCCKYLQWIALHEKEGYRKPRGSSGANIAIPFNIIAVVRNRGKENEYVEILINPKIVAASETMKTSSSNCGSLRLEKDIEVTRHEWIEIEFYDMDGKKRHRKSTNPTVQHEIDHNLGILITDRAVK